MKKGILALMLIMGLLIVSSCSTIAPTKGIRVYNTDYIKKYENTLNVMFDNNWTVASAEEKYEEHEEVCEHVDTRPQQFIEWAIEYHDGNGIMKTFIFDNRQSLSFQIETYVENYIADYYYENFYCPYFDDLPLAPSSYVFGFFTRASVNVHLEENKEWKNKTEKYRELLDTPEGTICLSQLTPENVFEMCPMYLSISVSFSGHPDDKQNFEKDVMNRIEDMIAEINDFTDGHLTASINMGYHEIIDLHTGNRNVTWSYIRGEQVFDAAGLYFDKHVFEGYKGLFW